MNYDNKAITLTFGDCAENHVGMQQIGEQLDHGFTYGDLLEIQRRFNSQQYCCQIYDIKTLGGLEDVPDVPDAYILIVENGVDLLLEELGANKYDLFQEQINLDYDKKAFMYGRVVNKHARWNMCFSNFDQEPDYENKMGRVMDFSDHRLTLTNHIRLALQNNCSSNYLQGEGNYYYDIRKTGIGFHGDSERKKVIGVKLGEIIPFEYQWFYKGEPVGDRIHFDLGDGDIYVMCDVATGHNWKRKNIYTLRHAVGCKKYLTI